MSVLFAGWLGSRAFLISLIPTGVGSLVGCFVSANPDNCSWLGNVAAVIDIVAVVAFLLLLFVCICC